MKQTHLKQFLISFILLFPLYSSAQMFSVGSGDGQNRSNIFAPFLMGGVEFIDFQFQGDPEFDPLLAFNGMAARASFESGGFNLGLSLGNNFTGLTDNNYFALNLNFINPFYFVRKPNFGLGVPIQLSSKLTSVGSDLSSNEFSQTNLSAGAGGIARYFVPEKFSITAQFIPSFGFSTASGGFIGGNVFSLNGKARIVFYNVIFNKNISLGYDYTFDSYNIDGEEFDYDLNGHTLTLGISL
ncbi:MAG: hypothetical protein WD022_06180 [Balneolaceae bacterium]